jgi:MFS transporter, PAT family, beta-lactamase induction signal transducer AmpG
MAPPTASIGGEGSVAAPAASAAAAYKNPFLWVPSSYFTMGLVYVTVGSVANIMFKNMGMPNDQAALWSSILGFPYTLKFLWAPLLELYRTKKFFVVLMQFILAGAVAGVAFAAKLPGMAFVLPVLALMTIAALAGATQDIGTDGVYVTTLDRKDQAKYTGFQSMCWNLGPILATGLLIRLTGTLHKNTNNWGTAWMVVMLIIAAILFLMGLYHIRMLPAGAKADDSPRSFGDAMGTFGKAFVTFFQKKSIVGLLAFAFLYRLGLGLLDKMGPLFLIDTTANGGLGLTNETLGDINGFFGTAAFILGSILGGMFVSKRGLRRSLVILCLCVNIPNATFLILSRANPASFHVVDFNILWFHFVLPMEVVAVVTVEKLGWGFGAVGHMIYMMQQIAPGPYRTAHYTFATALMGLCMMLTGAVSGFIQKAVGYQSFFIIVLFAAVPPLLATIFAPYPHGDITDEPAKA